MIYEVYIATCTTQSVLLRKNCIRLIKMINTNLLFTTAELLIETTLTYHFSDRPLHFDGSSQGSWEIFCRKRQKIIEGSIAPHFVEDGVHFYYIRRGGLLFVATSVKDVCATTVIEFLSRLYYMAKDFCGIVTEESVKANSLLLHEILCDVMDFGYVQIVSSEKVKPYVTSEAITTGSSSSDPEELVTRLFGIESHRAPATASHRPAVRTSLDGGQKNEIFVDLIERLTVVTDAKGNIGRMQVQGTINVKNFLLGHPKVKVALNEDLQISSRDQIKGFGSSALLDRCNFHQCVDLSEFDSSRIISFLPPPGEFSAMVYSLNEVGLNLPLRVTFFTRDIPNSRDVNVIMSVYCNIPGNNRAAYVIITLRLPSAISSVSQHVNGPSNSLHFKSDEKQMVWTINNLAGGEESTAHLRLISHLSQSITKTDIGPASVDFEISGHTMSGLQVRFMRVFELDHAYVPRRWIRSVLVSDSFTVKTA